MNQYGAIAQQHWKRWRPASYAANRTPPGYFTDLGEQAAGEIARLWAQMRAQAGNPPGEDYLARVARLNVICKQAEDIVLANLILLSPEPGAQQGGQPSSLAMACTAATWPCGSDPVMVTASPAGTSCWPFRPTSIRSMTWSGSADKLVTVSFLTVPPSR